MSSTSKGLTAMEKRISLRNSLVVAGGFFVFGLLTFLLGWVRHREISVASVLEIALSVVIS